MADENSPSTPSSSFPKKETVRITLPPRMNEAPSVKRETVRIAQNSPADKGQTIRITPKGTTSEPQPKKETTKIVSMGALPPPPKPAPIPVPPQKPAGMPAPIAPMAPPKPPAGAFSVPPAPARPSIKPPGPQAPAAPAAPEAPAAVAPKPNAPKKETSRIQLPSPTSRMQMPKATVKLQQTQPLPQGPAASVIKTSTLTTTGPIAATAEDPLVLIFSIVVFVASLASAVLGYLTYSACA